MDVRFVSSNPEKFREVRSVLGGLGIRVRWTRRSLPEPQADTLEDVVRAKLRNVDGLGGTVLVEDSGLFIASLGGFPGVYSAYVLQTVGLDGVLRLLKGRGRAAVFQTVVGVGRGRRSWMFRGEVRGRISAGSRGRHGFGYDPIFQPTGLSKTFAELTEPEKNRLSHRGRAFRSAGRALARGLPR